jgi:hypothetical protein
MTNEDSKIIARVLVNDSFNIKPIITQEDYDKLSDECKGPLALTIAFNKKYFEDKENGRSI